MGRYLCVLFCALLVLSITNPITAKRFGSSRPSYPKSGGLSGGGGHSYPASGGLSGGGHGYPSSGGSHGYPSSGGSHGYPSSGGSHGYPSSGGGLSGNSHGYPGSGSNRGYPSPGAGSANTHHTNNHGYPAGKGLSGNTNTGHTTNIHYNYNYNPPQQIRYTPTHGGAPVSYPVYHGNPPNYVYKYKDSGSKYGTLLAGLALLNLGTVAAGAYALSHSHSNYKPQPGEVCKFGLKKDNGDYEETKIDCQLITSFIFQEQEKTQHPSGTNTTITTTTVTNVTSVNITHPESGETTTTTVKPNPVYEMLPNGTLVPINVTAVNTTTNATMNSTNETAPMGNTMTSSVTITNTTTVTSALDVKGKEVDVTPVIISVCWVAGAGVGFLPLFGWHKGEDSAPGCYFVEVMDYNYLLFLYFATIVTPSVLLAAFYAHIYRVVINQMSAVVTVEGSQGRGGTMLRVLGAAQKREVKATQNLSIIVFFFIICWIPLYTINAIKAFMPELDIPNTLTYFCIIFSHLNSAINPLLYAYHLKDFRAALKGLICTIFGRGVPIPVGYRPPVPIRRPALERCNALRERPRVYVNSPVWLRQREAEIAANEERNMAASTSVPDMEPFLGRVAAEGSSGRHTPEIRETNNGPYLIDSNQERCQSPYKRVEDFIRRVRSLNSEHS